MMPHNCQSFPLVPVSLYSRMLIFDIPFLYVYGPSAYKGQRRALQNGDENMLRLRLFLFEIYTLIADARMI